MLSIRSDQLGDIIFRALQILIFALGILTILVFGSIFFRFDIWNEYSILSLFSGLIALAIPVLGSIGRAKHQNRKLDWERFQNRENILLKIADLQRLIGLYDELKESPLPQHGPYDPDHGESRSAVLDLLISIRKSVDESIYLGDLNTAQEVLGTIRSTLQNTPWIKYWISISLSSSDRGQEL